MVAARAVSIIDLLVLHSRRPTGSPPPHVLCRAQTNSRPTAGKTFGSELKPGLLDSSLVCLPRLKRSTRNRIRLASACLMRRSQRLAAVKVLPDPVAIWISARERSSRSSISNLVRLLAEAAARRHLLADDAATEGGRGICLVELRGRLSNPETRSLLVKLDALASRINAEDRDVPQSNRVPRRWRLIDRLGEQTVLDLLRDSRTGITQRGLAERYGISVSSVKRLLRHTTS